MASGSQTWSGNWADFPITARKISPAVASATSGRSATSQRKAPVRAKRRSSANRKPMSASLVIQNAFTAARAALGRSKWKPMRR
jgi:hypothetical protein